MAAKSPKRKSSSARLRDSGLRPLMLWLTLEKLEILREVAKAMGIPMTEVVYRHGVRRILKKSEKNSGKSGKTA